MPIIAQALGDVPGTVKYARRALDLLPEEDHLRRGIAAALLGLAYWASGDLEAADRTLADGMANMRMAGNILFAIRGTYALADIRMAQGRLREAIRTYEQSLQLATEQGELVLRGTADLYLRLSELYREQDNLESRHTAPAEKRGTGRASCRHRIGSIACALPRLESRRPREIWMALSTCWTRRNASMSGPPSRCASRRGVEDAGVGCAGQVGRSPGLGA